MNDYEELLVAVRRITRAIDLHSKKLYKEVGLTTSQLLVLEAVKKLPQPTPSSIAREILLSQATVTSLVDRLERNGLLKRSKDGPDKRTVNITITESGAGKISDAPELLQSGFLKEFRELQSWEQHMLLSSMQRVATMMDAEDIDAAPILTSGDIKISD
ncbi:MAG: MarR family transcriptional regulator [Gammaproteobacteria bacterium]